MHRIRYEYVPGGAAWSVVFCGWIVAKWFHDIAFLKIFKMWASMPMLNGENETDS